MKENLVSFFCKASAFYTFSIPFLDWNINNSMFATKPPGIRGLFTMTNAEAFFILNYLRMKDSGKKPQILPEAADFSTLSLRIPCKMAYFC